MLLLTHPITLSHKDTPTLETTHEQHPVTISLHQNFEPHLILKVHSLQLSAA